MIVIVAKPYVGFPDGTAATARVSAYARGLAAAGEDVHVILLGPSEIDPETAVNTQIRGVHKGVPFEYTSGSTLKHHSLLTRRWRVVSSLLNARRRIRELSDRQDIEAVLLYSGSPTTAAFFRRVSRAVGALYAVDLSEMPHHSLEPRSARDAEQERYGRSFVGCFDLVVAISSYLRDYAGRYLRPGAESIVLPIMVDCDEFRQEGGPSTAPRFVTYTGMLNERKDGVATLMTAFSRLAGDFPDVILRLVGDSDDARTSNVPEYREIAEGLSIAGRVEFTGQVPRSEIPRHLGEASVLVLARPSSQQADAGFPTKLGEYLASGRPVIVTRTSDISEYLTDGETAFIVPPGDLEALVTALRRVLSDPESASAVGAAGRHVAEESFDYRVAGRTLAAVLRRMRSARI